MAERKLERKIDGERLPGFTTAEPDKLAVSIKNIVPVKSGETLGEESKENETELGHFIELEKRRDAFSEKVTIYVLSSLANRIKTWKEERKMSEKVINAALKNLLMGQDTLGLGKDLLYPSDQRINDFALAHGLATLGATAENLTVSWIQNELKRIPTSKKKAAPPTQEELKLFYEGYCPLLFDMKIPSNLLAPEAFKKLTFSFDSSVDYAGRVQEVANVSYVMDSIGFGVMGPYHVTTNDCLDYAVYVVAKARGDKIPEGKKNPSDPYFDALKNEGSYESFGNWRDRRSKNQERSVMKKLEENGVAIAAVDSWRTQGNTHWVVLVKTNSGISVYSYEGRYGILRMDFEQLMKQAGRNGIRELRLPLPKENVNIVRFTGLTSEKRPTELTFSDFKAKNRLRS